MNYFCCDQQTVKINDGQSDWLNIFKGAPQGPLFEPFGYNVFSNDLLLLLLVLLREHL